MERYDELAKTSVSHLRQMGTPCSDDHHLKKNDFDVVGECALVSTQIFFTHLQEQSQSGTELAT